MTESQLELDIALEDKGFLVKPFGTTRLTETERGYTSRKTVEIQFDGRKSTIDLFGESLMFDPSTGYVLSSLIRIVDFVEMYDLEKVLTFEDDLSIAEATQKYREFERMARKIKTLCGDRLEELRELLEASME